MIKEAIILAGGLGTRLRPVVSDLPKCMAPVAGNPFLYYLVSYLARQGVKHFIFSVGYLHEKVEAYLERSFPSLDYTISKEEEPLGTGGAVFLAGSQVRGRETLVCNGDTFYAVDLQSLSGFHKQTGAECSLTLKPMDHFERYGAVDLNTDQSIQSFHEKKYCEAGLINGGVYALNTDIFLQEEFPQKFSFEKEYLEKKVASGTRVIFGQVQDAYFIDIGIPEDYERAQTELLMVNKGR